MIKNLSFEEFATLTSSCILVLIEFWSPACEICKKAEIYLEKLEKAYKNKLIVSKINVNDAVNLIDLYSIKRLPTFIIFKNTTELSRVVGFQNEFIIERTVRQHLK